ncbi:hypothetical protein B0H13DRAFT_2233080 [Mycena leptocephala]|nr:hypothetical protein B0H13DRAFT_2233080 [Mycena leptocephala]
MFLPWINMEVNTVHDALWYLLHLWDSPPPRLFALLVGINIYKDDSIRNLNGCVADVGDLQMFLEQTLRVPSSRIQVLLDEEATRAQIMQRHGSESSFGGNMNPKIQMLLPHDFIPQTNGEESSQAILDITLGAMLSDIAAAKGNNITVILDTCHAGSGTRKGISNGQNQNLNDDLMIRAVELPESYMILPSIDNDALSRRRGARTNGFRERGLASHVLLAACMQHQRARERYGRGVFSRELLQLFRTAGADKFTYKETIERIPDLPMQNPQCEGMHNQRVLFDGKVPATGRILYPARIQGEEIIISAGEAHGITRGAQFDVFSDHDLNPDKSTGCVVVVTKTFYSVARYVTGNADLQICTTDPQGSGPAVWARPIHLGEREDIRVLIPLREPFIDLFHYIAAMKETKKDIMRVRLVEETEPADMILHLEGECVGFEPSDSICQGYGLTRMPHIAPLEVIPLYHILTRAAHFYWHLNRTSRSQSSLAQSIMFECTQLGEDPSKPFAYPDEPILLPQGENLVSSDELTIDLDNRPSVEYGFTITNRSAYPLYAALFYFDMSDLSISPLYMPSHAKESNVLPSITANGDPLTIGYGTGGWPPTRFKLPTLPDGRLVDVDVGFLKLFISTKYVDYSLMPQESPFEDFRGIVMDLERRPGPEMWDTMKIAVVLRKKAAGSMSRQNR